MRGRFAPQAPSLRPDTEAPSKPHTLIRTFSPSHPTRYEEELSLRPCAENEFVALKKVREGSTGGQGPPELAQRASDTQALGSVRKCLQPTHLQRGLSPLRPQCQAQWPWERGGPASHTPC